MSRVHVYSGLFRKDRDVPVKPGLALSLQQFGRLTLDAQRSVLDAGSKVGDPGVANPDWHVPPPCRRGVSLAELERIYDNADARIRDGIQKKMAHDAFEKKIQSLQQSVEVNNSDNHGG